MKKNEVEEATIRTGKQSTPQHEGTQERRDVRSTILDHLKKNEGKAFDANEVRLALSLEINKAMSACDILRRDTKSGVKEIRDKEKRYYYGRLKA